MKMAKAYDPIKLWNKRTYLNDAAIKCRFDMMYINKFYKKEGYVFKDNNMFKNVNEPVFDKDIQDFKRKILDDNICDLKNRAKLITKSISESNICETIESLDHTSLMNIQTHIRNESKNKTKGVIKYLHDQQATELNDYHHLRRSLVQEDVKDRAGVPIKKMIKKRKTESESVSEKKIREINLKKFKAKQYGRKKCHKKKDFILLPPINSLNVKFDTIEPPKGDFIQEKLPALQEEYRQITLNNETEVIKNYILPPQEQQMTDKLISNSRKSPHIKNPGPGLFCLQSLIPLNTEPNVDSLSQRNSNNSFVNSLDNQICQTETIAEKRQLFRNLFNHKMNDHINSLSTNKITINDTTINCHDSNTNCNRWSFDLQDNSKIENKKRNKNEIITFQKKKQISPGIITQSKKNHVEIKQMYSELDGITEKIDNAYKGYDAAINKVNFEIENDNLFFPNVVKIVEKGKEEVIQVLKKNSD